MPAKRSPGAVAKAAPAPAPAAAAATSAGAAAAGSSGAAAAAKKKKKKKTGSSAAVSAKSKEMEAVEKTKQEAFAKLFVTLEYLKIVRRRRRRRRRRACPARRSSLFFVRAQEPLAVVLASEKGERDDRDIALAFLRQLLDLKPFLSTRARARGERTRTERCVAA